MQQLYTAKNQSGWSRSNNIIGRLIGITVGTGLAIALCGALTLALFATTVGASFQYLPAYVFPALYENQLVLTFSTTVRIFGASCTFDSMRV